MNKLLNEKNLIFLIFEKIAYKLYTRRKLLNLNLYSITLFFLIVKKILI